MKSRYQLYFFTSVLVFFGLGCKKLVEVSPPVSQLVIGSVFNGNSTATAAQLSIYAQMQNIPWTLAALTGLSSDEFTGYSTSQVYADLYKNALNSQSDASSLIWSAAYNYIYQENAILVNVAATGDISNNVKAQLEGEAKFMRAFWYFYLVNLYGNVPLITVTDYSTNSLSSRSPISAAYQQIVQDLKSAQNLLSNVYVDATDSVSTLDRVRPTRWVASALLARVYLYLGEYDSAETQASILINNGSLFRLTSLDSVFLKNSTEAIWQILPPSSHLYTWEGNYFVLTAPPGGGGLSNSFALSTAFLNSFEQGDNRKASWVGSYKSGTSLWNFPYKYKDNSVSATKLREYSMVFRLAEQYLIRAEARAKQNNISGAESDLNMLRSRAGLAALNPALSQAQIDSVVMHERQIELFSEGQRWLDLKRTGSIDSVMTKITPVKGGILWNTTQQLYPLPLTDLQSDVNLTQNPGY